VKPGLGRSFYTLQFQSSFFLVLGNLGLIPWKFSALKSAKEMSGNIKDMAHYNVWIDVSTGAQAHTLDYLYNLSRVVPFV